MIVVRTNALSGLFVFDPEEARNTVAKTAPLMTDPTAGNSAERKAMRRALGVRR